MIFVQSGQAWLCLLGALLRMRAALPPSLEVSGQKSTPQKRKKENKNIQGALLTASPLGPSIPG